MRLEKMTLKKTCSFYISENHLSTLLLPYISEKIKNNVQIIVFTEEYIKEYIEKVTEIFETEEYIKKEILQISWNKFKEIKYLDILENINIDERDVNIIIIGSKKYIEDLNSNLEKVIEIKNAKGLRNKIEMIINNCYPVKEVLSVKEILDKHDLLLNTSGEVAINEVFQGYQKVISI